MSEGLDTTVGEPQVAPVVQTPVLEVPATVVPGQVTTDSGSTDGQPAAQVTTEDSLPGGMPLPPNWDELPDHQKQAMRDSSAYWQTAMNGVAEKYKGEMASLESDAGMFRQLCDDKALLKEFAENRTGSVQPTATQAVPATVQPELPENLYEMSRDQLLGAVQTAVTNAQTGSQKELEQIKQQIKDQGTSTEVANLKAKFSDVDQYGAEIARLYRQGYPMEHAYILAKATSPSAGNNLPAAVVAAVPPPDQTSVASGSTAAIEESEADAFKGLSSFQILKKKAESGDQEAREAMTILDKQ